jgi:hypothetical protein
MTNIYSIIDSQKSPSEDIMQQDTSHHPAPSSGQSQTGIWATMFLLFGPSALTLWWVIHQSGI